MTDQFYEPGPGDQASLVILLAKLGFHPAKRSGHEHFYHSMLSSADRKASLCVNDKLGAWFDKGTRKGGNIIDFGMAYWKDLSPEQVAAKIHEVFSAPVKSGHGRPRKAVKIPHYIVKEIKAIGTHPAITDYLKNRAIFEVALSSMNEVYYYVKDQKGERKYFFAAGWKNENGSWVVHNKYFKGCLGQRAISFIQGHKKKLAVFEGYLNYLSWKMENADADQSILVLNTLALLNAGIAKAKEFSCIDIYLDRNNAGYIATKDFIKALPYASDRSAAYTNFNNYNDKLIASSKNPAISI